MAEDYVEVYENTKTPVPISLYNTDGTRFNLAGWSVTVYIHDTRQPADGTNRLAAGSVTIDSEANGEFTYTTSLTDTAFDEAQENAVKALLMFRLVFGSTYDFYTDPVPMFIKRNRVSSS